MKSLQVSPDEFRRAAERVTHFAAEFLAGIDARRNTPPISGSQVEQLFRGPLPEQGIGPAAFDALSDVIESSRTQNARFFGYVLGSGETIAATADLLASVLNQNVTAWRSGPAAVTIEHTVVAWLAEAVGCKGFSGSLTGGGSSANLMGLAMAREAKLAANGLGLAGGRQGMVYASEQVHMSIPKSVALLGIGQNNLRLIPTDDQYRLVPAALDQAIHKDKSEGKVPLAVVASAGTVNTGAIDPLPEIAAIARQHGLWFHLDGAYGALAAIAAPEKFKGINLADSLSLDPHKWLYQPLDCGCLLYRDPAAARTAFSHTGDYAKVLSSDPIEGFAFFEESIELSRRFRALRLWLSLRYHGLAAFRDAIKRNLDHAQKLAAAVRNNPDLELVAFGDLSAVCFRWVGRKAAAEDTVNRANADLLKQVLHRGHVYLSNATLHDKFCLRACIVNHRTTDADVDAVVTEVLAAATDLQLPSSTPS